MGEQGSEDAQAHRDQGRPRPEQPWLHHLEIAVDGPLTTLAAQDGSIDAGAEGVYLDDIRILSRLVVAIDGGLSQVACATVGDASEFLNSARNLGDPGADPSVEIHQRRLLAAPGMTETISVRSRASTPVLATVTVELAADGLDIAAVKQGAPEGPLVAMSTDGATVAWSTPRHTTTGTFTPHPARLAERPGGGVCAEFPLRLEPGGEETITLRVASVRTEASLLDADAGSGLLAFDGHFEATADDPRVMQAVSAALRDLQHLALTDPEGEGDVFLAAGSPWYLTLFGRDSLWAARMLLPLGTDLALGTLRTLARRQGVKVDEGVAEQPGKIPHEVRRAADPGAGHQLPPVYYGTVDATSLWVCLLEEALAWGLPKADAVGLLPALRGALTWLNEHAAPDGDGLIKYVDTTGTGLVNQGWKDSGDSIRFRDGRIADAPIALIEAQAYAVQAGHAGARMLRELGSVDDEPLAAAAEGRAHELSALIRQGYWVDSKEGRWPAIALDGHGQRVTGIASNMGHVLGTGAVSAEDAATIGKLLLAPNMLGNYGIRTFADDNGGFNPIGYHTGSVWIHDTAICALGLAAEGLLDEASVVAQRMLDATAYFGFRNPELYGDTGVLHRPIPYPASCRPQAWSAAATIAMITAALGLRVDARAHVLTVREGGSPFGAVRLKGLVIAGDPITLSLGRSGELDLLGLPDGWSIERV